MKTLLQGHSFWQTNKGDIHNVDTVCNIHPEAIVSISSI